tara:strand:+ start:591 stop:1133 length:543 start_codon:yes stop_codon:yes gene_type:complete
MGIDLVVFIVAILFGIFLYWRESNGNGAYRFLNKIMNSKELQMRADNPKGFVYKQSFLPRLIFVVTLVLIAALILEIISPLKVFSSYNGISAFASFVAGTLIGTYVASFVIKSSEVIEEQSESLEDKFDNVVEKGKDFFEDLKNKDIKAVEEAKKEIENELKPKTEEKSARERLKDKGLM